MSEQNLYIAEIKQILTSARQKAYSAINFAMVEAYWLIGRRIVEEEQQGKERAEYGAYVIENLSKELTAEFGKGFSKRSIFQFRQFYQMFPEIEIRRSPIAELQSADKQEGVIVREPLAQFKNTEYSQYLSRLNWTQIQRIMRVSNPDARAYYIKETAENMWSSTTLDRNISTLYYQRLLSSANKEPVIEEMQEKTKEFQLDKLEFIKNPAVLEFIGLPANKGYTETELEQTIIDNLQNFLLELGKGFAFVERQQLVRTETQDFYIDLVFYNYILKCFVVIELKTNKIMHQDIGQLDMYVRMYDDLKRRPGDNPTIGILLCTETDKTIAQYSILNDEEKVQTLSALLSWSHNTLLLNKSKTREEIEWYTTQTIENGWSLSALEHHIETKVFHRQVIAEKTSNYERLLPAPFSELAEETLKNPYIFDFVEKRKGIIEREIEHELVANIAKTIMELGTGFAFVGNQYHIEVSKKDYYIDLLFYNTKLRCYVVIELKNTEFKPEYAGQLNFYLSAVDDILKHESDNPPIGIMLCKTKDKLTAEYALKDINKPIGVSEYKLSDFVPTELANTLPSAEDIEKRVRMEFDIEDGLQ